MTTQKETWAEDISDPVVRMLALKTGVVLDYHYVNSPQYKLTMLKVTSFKPIKQLHDDVALLYGVDPGSLIFFPVVEANYCAFAVVKPESQWQSAVHKPEKLVPGTVSYHVMRSLQKQDIISNFDNDPHGIIWGRTDSGKTTAIAARILGALLTSIKPIIHFIDPKIVNSFFEPYIDSYLTEQKEGADLLIDIVVQSERRLSFLAECGVKTAKQFNAMPANKKSESAIRSLMQDLPNHLVFDGGNNFYLRTVVVYFDELKDFLPANIAEVAERNALDKDDPEKAAMLSHEKIAYALSRIMAKYRAAGISAQLASQYFTSELMSGTVLSNISSILVLPLGTYQQSDKAFGRTQRPGADLIPPKGGCIFRGSGQNPVYGRVPEVTEEIFANTVKEYGL